MRKKINDVKESEHISTYIRFNRKLNLYELVGSYLRTLQLNGRTEYYTKQVVIKTGSKESCEYLEKILSPEKYF